MKLGTQVDEPLELTRDSIALGDDLRFLLAQYVAMIGLAVLHPANEARRELAGTIALAGRLDVGFLDLGQQAVGFSPVGRELGPPARNAARASVKDRSRSEKRCCC